jgi:hypothetical protein
VSGSYRTEEGEEKMKKETFNGKVEQAYGEKLPKAIHFSGDYDKLEKSDIPSIRTSKEWLSDEDIIDVLNAKRLAASKAKVSTEALNEAGYFKPDAEDPTFVFNSMVKNLMNAKKSEADAVRMTTGALGYDLDTARKMSRERNAQKRAEAEAEKSVEVVA